MTIGVKISMLEQLQNFIEQLQNSMEYYRREITETQEKLSTIDKQEDSWTYSHYMSRLTSYNNRIEACDYLLKQFEKMV